METRTGNQKSERFNISPKSDPRDIERRKVFTSIIIALFAASTLLFGFIWNNRSSREGSDASSEPVQASKRDLPGAKLTEESKAALETRSPKEKGLEHES